MDYEVCCNDICDGFIWNLSMLNREENFELTLLLVMYDL